MDERYLATFKHIFRRILGVGAVLLVAAIAFWLIRRPWTGQAFGNALSIAGFLSIALGCLSLAGKWEFSRPKRLTKNDPILQASPLVRFFYRCLDFIDANLVMTTLTLAGIFALAIGETLARLLAVD